MAKKSIIARDKKRKSIINRFKEVRNTLRTMVVNMGLPAEERFDAAKKLSQLPRNSSPIRLQRRCTQCGRPHAVYRKFALCRLCLRKVLMTGLVPGGRKSSW